MPARPSRRPLCLALTGLATTGTLLASAAPALAAPDPVSAPPAPAVVEGFSPYLPQTDCDPTAKPGTVRLRSLLLSTYGGRDLGIVRDCIVGDTSEHHDGRAFDFGLNAFDPGEAATAKQFLGWLLAPGPDGQDAYQARRLGIMYVIWNRQIWGAYASGAGWRPYTGPEPHTDHIHISLSWNGAMGTTSFWTGAAAATDYGPCQAYVGLPAPTYSGPRALPCPPAVSPLTLTGTPALTVGSSGPYVLQLQVLLKVAGDGFFGPRTADALGAFQSARGLPPTRSTDPTTWARLRAPAPVPAPVPAPEGTPAGGTAPGAAPAPAPAAPVDPQSLAPYAGTTLRQGDRGPAVAALQRALGVEADGDFGALTAAAVSRFHADHAMPAEPVAGPATWRALGAPPLPAPPQPAPPAPTAPALAPPAPTAPALAPPAPVPPARPVPATSNPARPVPARPVPARPVPARPVPARPVTRTAPAPRPAPTAAAARAAALRPYRALTLRLGSRGAGVVALQRALGLTADGQFGPATAAAVRAYSRAHHLPVDGVATPATWTALGA